MNHAVPNTYNDKSPVVKEINWTGSLLPYIFVIIQYIRGEIIKPIMYPPVGPNNLANPPAGPENTGTPTAPRSMYIKTEIVPRFPPRMTTARKTPKVCIVNGTTVGIDIHEQIVITTANNAI